MDNTLKARARLHAARHLKINEINYLYLITALVAGIAAGAFVVGCLDRSLKLEIAVIFRNYQAALSSGERRAVADVLIDNVLPIIRQMAFIALCGMTPLALAAGILLNGAKGFALGFFIASAVSCLDMKAAAMLLLPSTPYQIVSVSVLLAASGVAAARRKINEKGYVYALEMLALFAVYVLAVALDFLIKC